MKRLLIASLLLVVIGSQAARAQFSPRSLRVLQTAPAPSRAYWLLFMEASALFRRASALPDGQAVALLHQQLPGLEARAKPIVLAYRKWAGGLTAQGLAAERARAAGSLDEDMAAVFNQVKPQFFRNPATGPPVTKLLTLLGDAFPVNSLATP